MARIRIHLAWDIELEGTADELRDGLTYGLQLGWAALEESETPELTQKARSAELVHYDIEEL